MGVCSSCLGSGRRDNTDVSIPLCSWATSSVTVVADGVSERGAQLDYIVALTWHSLISSPNPLGYSMMTFTSPGMAMERSTITSRAVNPTPAT